MLPRQIRRVIIRGGVRQAIQHGLVQYGVVSNGPRAAPGNDPFLPGRLQSPVPVPARHVFQEPPGTLQGIVHGPGRIRRRVFGAWKAAEDFLDTNRNREQPGGAGLRQHPFQRDLGQTALRLGIAAAHIGVHTCEPDLFVILSRPWLAP